LVSFAFFSMLLSMYTGDANLKGESTHQQWLYLKLTNKINIIVYLIEFTKMLFIESVILVHRFHLLDDTKKNARRRQVTLAKIQCSKINLHTQSSPEEFHGGNVLDKSENICIFISMNLLAFNCWESYAKDAPIATHFCSIWANVTQFVRRLRPHSNVWKFTQTNTCKKRCL